MIGWGDVYKVVAAMAPLYFALALGYCSVRRWKLFTPDQCDAVNRLVAYFAVPFFAFDFSARINPYALNYRVLAADALSKLAVALALAAWAAAVKAKQRGAGGDKLLAASSGWCITGFSLATLNNTLVVGVPLLDAMYGPWARDLVVQLSVVQIIVYFPLLLLAFEARRACAGGAGNKPAAPPASDDDVEGAAGRIEPVDYQSAWALVRAVGLKVARNPNVYAGVLGVAWSCVTNRWHIETPSIIEGSVLIMSRTGVGLAMFSMGLFMALQERIVACGAGPTALGMALRFVAGPAATAAGAVALGLRGDVLRLAIIQAALPQSITTFVFAREYGLHADVLSTAVIFGTLVSLPVLIVYYIALAFVG
ncbi:probable auxin efflux carrier component 5b isoform X2 [Brachypodium distachyon]|uniref:Auxin efflux carrier component n=1 Tax=Brachypodium distachyon TaxID=15368 RepID=A0A0Q3LE65_BRADI|nr:probable auxin efflux carrier component 5b isoform X2 [Brachypodium distachyon]KQJ90909.1 hypothetical protein BRADI_4g34510v3 [Brachypodium distachyon]|eukprot:XP_003576710.1 probable auxin efflux carrier component 5b isoform X2 [Brachypodium distachyon]